MEKLCYSLDDIVGHRHVVNYLKSKLASDTVNDVILLQGPTGLGKSSIAKILACEIAYKYNNSSLTMEEAKKRIIGEKENTTEVLVYNMSVLKDNTAVQDVMANLSLGFSNTGRKVIIMDEAHGMTDEQQDFLLTSLEHLQNGVYVIICTTDTTGFRDALIGRCKMPLHLNKLTESEIKTLIKQYVEENKLRFEMPLNTVISAISNYTGNEPRSALNLLSNFEPDTLVSTRDLEVFINVDECEQIVQLIKYLYGPVIVGIEYLNDMRTEHTFVRSLVEVTKCALGATTTRLKRDSVMIIRQYVEEYGSECILGFCIDVASAGKLSKNRIIGFFMKWNYECRALLGKGAKPEKTDFDRTVQRDIGTMQQTLEKKDGVVAANRGVPQVQSLATLLGESEDME